jgi:tetratricopeptide (TPR) repeat protein
MIRNKYISKTKMGNCKIAIIFFLLVIPFIMVAQDETASLIEKLQQAKGNQKVDLLNEISVIYRKSDRYIALDYARKAYSLATGSRYLPGKALARKNEGICWFFVGNNDSATICYTEALEIFTLLKDQKGMSACYNNLGLIAQETGMYDEAFKLYQSSIVIDKKLGDEIGFAVTMENMADIHLYRGNAKKAMIITNECIAIYKRNSYKPGLLASYLNRAAEYEYLRNYDKAISDNILALNLAFELNDIYSEIQITGNMGVNYWHLGKPEVALQYLDAALGKSENIDDAFIIDNILKVKAEVFTSLKRYAEANDILQVVLKSYEQNENNRQVAVSMTAIGRNLIELNEIDKAFGYLNKSLQISTDLAAPYEKLENYRNLVYANAIMHNFKSADSLQDLFAVTYSEILNSDSIPPDKEMFTISDQSAIITKSTASNWIVAFLLLILVTIVSVFAYRGKQR